MPQRHCDLYRRPVTTLIKGQAWYVKSTAFFVLERELALTNNTLTCGNRKLTINLKYTKLVRKDPEYFITLD